MKGKKDQTNGWLFQIRRVALEIAVFLSILFMFTFDYSPVSPSVQLVLFKMLLVSAGFLHAHIMRKLAFPSVSWLGDDNKYLKMMIAAIYVVVIWAYARGG